MTDAERELLCPRCAEVAAGICRNVGKRLSHGAGYACNIAADEIEHAGKQESGALLDGHPKGNVPAATTVLPASRARSAIAPETVSVLLTFDAFRAANVARCIKWHPQGIDSWSPSDWLTAVTGELGELASLLKMRNRERDGLPGNKFSPTHKQIADELADVLTYLDLLAAVLSVDLGHAAVEKFNEVSERVGFPDRIKVSQ